MPRACAGGRPRVCRLGGRDAVPPVLGDAVRFRCRDGDAIGPDVVARIDVPLGHEKPRHRLDVNARRRRRRSNGMKPALRQRATEEALAGSQRQIPEGGLDQDRANSVVGWVRRSLERVGQVAEDRTRTGPKDAGVVTRLLDALDGPRAERVLAGRQDVEAAVGGRCGIEIGTNTTPADHAGQQIGGADHLEQPGCRVPAHSVDELVERRRPAVKPVAQIGLSPRKDRGLGSLRYLACLEAPFERARIVAVPQARRQRDGNEFDGVLPADCDRQEAPGQPLPGTLLRHQHARGVDVLGDAMRTEGDVSPAHVHVRHDLVPDLKASVAAVERRRATQPIDVDRAEDREPGQRGFPAGREIDQSHAHEPAESLQVPEAVRPGETGRIARRRLRLAGLRPNGHLACHAAAPFRLVDS